ncbi:MAG: N-6 DNA methylase [Deltaproteobacteria bacterium]|jgi:type I restriction enzyme M protein|nr:N-6 DNA methylase [Deltaproteobacteria bacterium]
MDLSSNNDLKEGYVSDGATGKPVDGRKPEEVVRQSYEKELCDNYGYDYAQMDIEVYIQRGEKNNRKNKDEKERADIVIYSSSNINKRSQYEDIIGIVETKRPTRKDGVKQLASYMSATSCRWGVWTNGAEIEYLYRDVNSGIIKRDFVFQIPKNSETFEDIGRISKDNLQPSNNLRVVFNRLLKTLYANTNISRREKLGAEMIRLLFCKIWDENYNRNSLPNFRIGFGEKPKHIAKRIKQLFNEVKNDLAQDGVFDKNEDIKLDDKSIAYVVGQLDKYSLIKTDKDVIGDAFEVFAESKLVGEKGEFFTPREVVKMAVKIINPTPKQTIVDPACGSGGFLIYSLEHVWNVMKEERQWKGLPDDELKNEQRKIAERYFYGIDKEIDLVKITKAYMAIIGDGKSKIVQENTLHELSEYNPRAKELFLEDDAMKKFDCVFTNPPFGSKIKVLEDDSQHFDLGHVWEKSKDGWTKTDKIKATEPQVLFIERCLQMLKTGGKLAIILPETYFHAPMVRYVLEYMVTGNNIMAIIDLPHNTFRPYCNAKTLLLVLQKNKPQQDNIIMAVCEGIGHDHNGKPLYRFDERNIVFTNSIWDDSKDIIRELDNPYSSSNNYVFAVSKKNIKGHIYVPRYYWNKRVAKIEEEAEEQGLYLISVKKLIDEEILKSFPGHGSPEAKFKGLGNIPYVRVADIMNWSIYKNPTAFIPDFEYKRVKSKGFDLKEKDILFIRRGSYRIGSVAMVSKFDTNVLLTKEIQTFRIIKEENEYDIDAFYLLYLFSHTLTQKQIYNKVLIDTTLPNIADRWKELRLPIAKDKIQRESIKESIRNSFIKKWQGQEEIELITKQFGYLTT